MIHVERQPEPETFDVQVRQPGLNNLAQCRAINNYWRHCHNDLYNAYQGYCAYLAVKIPRAPDPNGNVGYSTVEHFLPKGRYPHLAYEWKNYRLGCEDINNIKDNKVGILDPFFIQDNWFYLDDISNEGKLYPNPALSRKMREAILKTIDKLGLNRAKFCNYRKTLLNEAPETLLVESPFLFHEAQRLGLFEDEPV